MKRLTCLCLVCTLAISSVASAADIRTVALSGQQAPGTPDGVNYGVSTTGSVVFTSLVLNDTGQTAFVARLTGSGVNSSNERGLWSEGSGRLALVARSGEHAPGTPSGVNYSFAFGIPVLNDAGQTAFYATNLTGSGVNAINDAGIWSEGSGSLALVVRELDHAPGTPSGVNYSSVNFRPVLNNIGQTAFFAQLTGSGVDSTNARGIWSEGSGSLALVARGGSQAPGTLSGVNYLFTGDIRRPVLNDAGQTAFAASLIGSGVDSTNNQGIWSEGSGSLALLARTGSQAPGTPSGVNYSSFSNPVINNAGRTAFLAGLSGGGIGIWSEGSGSLALVARSGDHAPGTPNGVNYAYLFDPVLNNAGQTAFAAHLTSIGVDGAYDTGIWSEGSGSLALVALSGDHAPGSPNGVNFSSFNVFDLQFALNDAGQTAFLASLTDGNQGIWATDRTGALQLIALRGDPLEVAPGDFRTIGFLTLFDPASVDASTGNSDGRPSFFNNSGQLAFSASFTDGTSGIFVSNRVAIPEPCALALASISMVGLVAAARRPCREVGRASAESISYGW